MTRPALADSRRLTAPPTVGPREQARAVAKWIHDGGQDGDKAASFPGLAWLRQPDSYSDREWILEIRWQYHDLITAATSHPCRWRPRRSSQADGATPARPTG